MIRALFQLLGLWEALKTLADHIAAAKNWPLS